jgi:ADP-heptose:LPS heptosyltransferase
MGYYVIQVGTSKDNQIPTVDLKFLDKPISQLAWLIDNSSLWISVDTFFHHFASAIKPDVGICLTPFYNDHAKHTGVKYIEKDCGKNYWDRRWWMDLQQPERKECMDLIQVDDVLKQI